MPEEKTPLPDRALTAIAGGDDSNPEDYEKDTCPRCGSADIHAYPTEYGTYYECRSCGYTWR